MGGSGVASVELKKKRVEEGSPGFEAVGSMMGEEFQFKSVDGKGGLVGR